MKSIVNIHSEESILSAISEARRIVSSLNMSLADEQKLIVSVAELSRNILYHANGQGYVILERLNHGVRLTAVDRGPGIKNLDLIKREGKVASNTGLGKGLAGVMRIMDEIKIECMQEGGTRIVVFKRKN